MHFSKVWKSNTPTLPCSTTPARTAGLTLIEVMLAIVILGVGAGTLLVATARCVAVATKARHYSAAHRLMLRVDVENPLTRGEIEDGVESGTFDDRYSWEREILESENEDREGLYTIRTRVSWSARGRDAFEEAVTYLYVSPKKAPPHRMRSR
ncbi:MAG: prepilin-type N-terminal cleavage/methylation domain-containing protein [Kiritimatiellales bacterium]|nr:prepilin-type N-terminal cleavage/methylation domain-containing protein [Kiritimatiellota bacterium]MBL7011990.1 prepilin-type N-terminal cleavage/methylation domain-containing protein [Kiritimatiellales bacterium]